MKVVVDTNVIASGIFWSGLPLAILENFFNKAIDIVISQAIFDEYASVLSLLGNQYNTSIHHLIEAIKIQASWVMPVTLSEHICQDEDDDKFIACAMSANANTIISGDKLLLRCSGYGNIEIITPKLLIEKYLSSYIAV